MSMKFGSFLLLLTLTVTSFVSNAADQSSGASDSLYHELIRTVADTDFEAMSATYHPDAVLVTADYSRPISMVMPVWKAAGEKHKKEGGTAFLNFRFSSRLSSDQTNFATGIFRYGTRDSNGVENIAYIHFQELNVRKGERWLTVMERQMSETTVEEWEKLPVWE